MNVEILDQTNTLAVIKNKTIGFPNRVVGKYGAFQAPFQERQVLLALGDALLVMLAVLGAILLWHQAEPTDLEFKSRILSRWYWFPILMGGWWTLAWLNDLYHIPSSFGKMSSAKRVAIVGGINLAVYLAVFAVIPADLPRLVFLYFLVIVWSAITLWRLLYAVLFSPSQYRVLVVGHGKRAHAVARILREASELNYQVLGYVQDARTPPLETASDGLPVLGGTAELRDLVKQLQVQEVVIALEQTLRKNLFERLVECQSNGVRVSLMSDLYEKLCRKIPIEYVDANWALHVMQDRPVFNRLQLAMKRVLDLVGGMVGLLVFGLCLPLAALAIRLDSPGPIFYRQARCGRAGRTFCIVKFRTMTQDAEKDGQPKWATKSDARITRVGRIMRKTRLDELPQVLNVLRGEMSIVGPRPERPEFVAELLRDIPFYRTRMMVKPGLTGWAQVHYDYGNSSEDALIKLQYDFYYLRYWSLWLDLYIAFRTFGVVLGFKGT